MLKVTFQVAILGAESAVYDCLLFVVVAVVVLLLLLLLLVLWDYTVVRTDG